jgi:hypothetical protein
MSASKEDEMQRSTEHLYRLARTFTAALDLLDEQHREPDRWEEECLTYALGAIACGLYPAAEVELEAFARPVSERRPEEVADLENKPRRFTKQMLRHGIAHVLNSDDAEPAPATNHLAVRAFLGASL